MSAPTSYSELKAAVRDYGGIDSSSEYASAIDLFIDLAEARFNALLRTRNQITSTSLTLDSDGEAALPDDYAGFYRASVVQGGRTIDLEECSPDWMDDQYPITASGFPKYITVEGATVRVRPTTASTVSFRYYATLPALSNSQTSNWLLTKLPGLYIAAAIYEAGVFFEEPETANRFGQMMQNQIDLLNQTDMSERVARRRLSVKGATP